MSAEAHVPLQWLHDNGLKTNTANISKSKMNTPMDGSLRQCDPVVLHGGTPIGRMVTLTAEQYEALYLTPKE